MFAVLNKQLFDFEDFEEEIVLIHIQSGVYYTIKGSGPAIFRLLVDAVDTDKLADQLASQATPEWAATVNDFVNQLLTEGILIPTDALAGAVPDLTQLHEQGPAILEKFDDVSDLIKLDPIHDVSDLGWPHKK